MSKFLTRLQDGTMLEEIESLDICKWRIDEVCCNGDCDYVGDYPYPYCECKNKEQCEYFEKEDGIVENDGKPFRL